MNFRTPYNRQQEVPVPSSLPSQTQPQQALTIREILHRYATGRPIPINKNLVFGGGIYYPDPNTLDLTDRQKLYEEAQERIEQLQEKLKTEQDEHNRAVQEKRLKDFEEMSAHFKKSTENAPDEEARTA